MINIEIAELTSFFQKAASIKDSNLLPVYSYIKLECKGKNVTLTKSNGHSFCVYQTKADFKKDITVLLNEQIVSSITERRQGVMKIELNDLMVELSGDVNKTRFQTTPAQNFSAIQPIDKEERFEMGEDVLSALSYAKTYLKKDRESSGYFSLVYMKTVNKKKYVVGTNGAMVYAFGFKNKLPELSLTPETVDVISKFSGVSYCRAGNYDIFSIDDATYGFIQTDNIPLPDIGPIILDKLDVKNNFTINREEILDFCVRSFKSNTSHVNTEILLQDAGKDGIRLYFKGIADELEQEIFTKVKKSNKKVEDFNFIASQMIIALNAVDSETLQFNRVGYDFFITCPEEPNYLSTIRMVQYPNEAKAVQKAKQE